MIFLNKFFIIFAIFNLKSSIKDYKAGNNNISSANSKDKKTTRKEKKEKNKIKDSKDVLSLQSKILKKDLDFRKKNESDLKKKVPRDYFTQIISPLNSNELDSKISEAIKYGAQILLIINWRDDTNDKLFIEQLIQDFSNSNDLLNSYGILVASLQTQISSLQEVVKVLGFGDTNGVSQAATDNTASYHPGIIACLLPSNPIPEGTTYFVENSTLQLSSAKLILDSTGIKAGDQEKYSSTGSSKGDPSVLTSISLSTDLPGKIKTAIQSYAQSFSIKSLKDETAFGKVKLKAKNKADDIRSKYSKKAVTANNPDAITNNSAQSSPQNAS